MKYYFLDFYRIILIRWKKHLNRCFYFLGCIDLILRGFVVDRPCNCQCFPSQSLLDNTSTRSFGLFTPNYSRVDRNAMDSISQSEPMTKLTYNLGLLIFIFLLIFSGYIIDEPFYQLFTWVFTNLILDPKTSLFIDI